MAQYSRQILKISRSGTCETLIRYRCAFSSTSWFSAFSSRRTWASRKLLRNSARLSTSSWSASVLVSYTPAMSVDGGIMRLIEVITILNSTTNLASYSGPTCRFTISDRHLSVTLRKSGTSRKRLTRLSITLVSKMNPSGIQFRKRSMVSRVALISDGLVAFSSTSVHSTTSNAPSRMPSACASPMIRTPAPRRMSRPTRAGQCAP